MKDPEEKDQNTKEIIETIQPEGVEEEEEEDFKEEGILIDPEMKGRILGFIWIYKSILMIKYQLGGFIKKYIKSRKDKKNIKIKYIKNLKNKKNIKYIKSRKDKKIIKKIKKK